MNSRFLLENPIEITQIPRPMSVHAIDIVSTEIDRNMGLLGINSLSELDAAYLYRRPETGGVA